MSIEFTSSTEDMKHFTFLFNFYPIYKILLAYFGSLISQFHCLIIDDFPYDKRIREFLVEVKYLYSWKH